MSDSKTTRSLADVRGDIDFGIISVRVDEFDAVLKYFGNEELIEGAQKYTLSTVRVSPDRGYSVAMVRVPNQGHVAAAKTAEALITDLDPKWLLLVGIGGAVPDAEYSLGDVLLGLRTVDFSVQAAIQGRPPEFDARGSFSHPKVEDLLAYLPAIRNELAGWSDTIAAPLPAVPLVDEKFYGDADWKDKTRRSLQGHFGQAPFRKRTFYPGTIGTSNTLVKDSELTIQLSKFARSLIGFEMEAGGVFSAARRKDKEYPVLNIRGVSDVVGYKRAPEWTAFACEAAAAFAYRLVLTGKIQPTRPIAAITSVPARREPPRKIPAAFELKRAHTLDDGSPIHGFAWSPDGTRIACEGSGKAILLDLDAGVVTARSDGGVFHNLAWSPDGKYLAGGTAGGGILIWETAEGTELGRLSNATSFATEDVAWAPNGRQILSAQDYIVYLWSVEIDAWNNVSGGSEPLLRGAHRFSNIAFSPDGSRLATNAYHTLQIWDVVSRTAVATATTDQFVNRLQWSSDPTVVAYGALHSSGLWEFTAGQPPKAIEVNGVKAGSISLSPDGALIAATANGSLVMIRRSDMKPIATLLPEATHLSVTQVAFGPHSGLVAVAGPTKRKPHNVECQLWQFDSAKASSV